MSGNSTAHVILRRHLLLIQHLHSRRNGVTVNELVDELEAGDKTIRRDLQFLKDEGFPLVSETREYGKKYWRLTRASAVPINWTFEEAFSLYLGRRFLEPLAGTNFWQAAQLAFGKLRSQFGDRPLAYLERVADQFIHTAPGTSDYNAKAELIDDLMVAIEDRLAVFLTYHSLRSSEPISYDIHPYGWAYHQGSLYVIGHSNQHGELRTWKVDRIVRVELTEVRFQLPEGFSLSDYLQHSFGIWKGAEAVEVRVRFHGAAARFVAEKRWHASQQLRPLDGGDVELILSLGDTSELRSWIRSFGPAATVISPARLRDQILDDLHDTLANYTPAPQ